MDVSFFKSKAEELAKAAAAKAEELKEGANLLSQSFDIDALEASAVVDGNKHVEFASTQFGFRLEGTVVVHIDPDGQAEKLGVALGDRLVKVAGYDLPEYKFGDAAGEERAENAAKKMLKECPAPVRLSFAPPPALDSLPESSAPDEAADEDDEDEVCDELNATAAAETVALDAEQPQEDVLEMPTAEAPREETPIADAERPAAEQSAAEASPVTTSVPSARLQALQGELQKEKEKRQKLAAELKEARQARAILTGNLEAEKKKSASHEKRASEVSEELAVYKAQNAELLLSASRGEADSDAAREAWEAREKALQAQVQSLEEAVNAAKAAGKVATEDAVKESAAAAAAAEARAKAAESSASALTEEVVSQKVAMAELKAQLRATEDRASAAETKLNDMERGFGGFRAAHDAEVELTREEQDRMQRQVTRLLEASETYERQKREMEQNLEKLKSELAEARRSEAAQREIAEARAVEVAAAGVEAAAARAAAAEAEERANTATRESSEAVAKDSPKGDAEANDDADNDDAAEDESPLPQRLESGRFAGKPVSSGAETSQLYARIDLLQARCSALQEKLIAQRMVGSNVQGAAAGAGGGQRIPAWLPHVTKVAGPKVGQISVLVFSAVDRVLRGFTQRLLARDMWLWLFYAHLIVLYTIAGSCYYTQAAPNPNSPMEIINAQLDKNKIDRGPSVQVAPR